MKEFRYLPGVTTLSLDREACIGCGNCVEVCPHAVFEVRGKKALVMDRDCCMECGACATNCPADAISVAPGVGCAAHIIGQWLSKVGISSKGCC